MHKNKYDHNILLNDIQKLDKIQHKRSLVAIQFPDTSAEKKYLVYYDERWDCKLFLNYKTVDRADEESVINKVSADLNVDPDDRTPLAIKNTGAEIVTYGAPVLPGAMFLLSYYGEKKRPVIGLPGCVMYAKRTIFDLVLPRIVAGEILKKSRY